MEWSIDLHLVLLLQEYVALEAQVADFVHKQLIMDSEKDKITVAICQVKKLYWAILTLFDGFLNYSSLNWTNKEEIDEAVLMLHNRMFNLIRRMLLNQYKEVRDIQHHFEDFISVHALYIGSRCNDLLIWWDSINVGEAPVKQ